MSTEGKFRMHWVKGSVLVLFAVGIIACTSGSALEPAAVLATSAQPLLAQGLPCLDDSQCGTGHCVDAVCCNSACGSGLRDGFSCSNVYGTVPGLTAGTCKALAPTDP